MGAAPGPGYVAGSHLGSLSFAVRPDFSSMLFRCNPAATGCGSKRGSEQDSIVAAADGRCQPA